MNIQDIVQLISTVGFPIIACWYLATHMNKTLAELTTVINNLNSRLRSRDTISVETNKED